MAESQYAVVFRGRLIEGADGTAVRANFVKLFNTDAARIEKMFSGQAVIIKKGLDEAAAKKYQAVLAKAGAVVDIVDAGSSVAAPTSSAEKVPAAAPAVASAPAPEAVAGSRTAVPSTPAPAAAPRPAAVPAVATTTAPPRPLDTSMAEPGVILVEPQKIAAPDIDTAHLSMAEAGATLVDYVKRDEPQYDLSGLSLDPPGTTLVEPHKVAPPEFDLSALSLAPGPEKSDSKG